MSARPASRQTRPVRRASTAVAGVLSVLALAACGADRPGDVVVTVTASPGQDSGKPSSGSSSRTSSPAKKTLVSEAKGRKFDFGRVVRLTTVDGTPVFRLDRWTVPGLDDAKLAQQGVVVRPYDLKKVPYDNVNTTNTFTVPVADGASFLLHHCVAKGEPLQSRSVTPQELADAPAEDSLVVLTIDGRGYATGGETLAGC